MKRLLKVLVFGVLVPVVLMAAAEQTVDLVNSPRPQLFRSGIYVGSGAIAPEGSTTNKVTNTLACTLVYQFGAVASDACALSAPGTCASLQFGDAVALGMDQVMVADDAGMEFRPLVSAAGQFKIQACNVGVGASFTVPDASYTVRSFSNQ